MLKSRAVTWSILVALNSGCSSAVLLPNVEPATQPVPSTALAINYTFESKDRFIENGECTATFWNADRNIKYSAKIFPPSGRIFVQAPPGATLLSDIYCYGSANWEWPKDAKRLADIRPDKINLMGTLQFEDNSRHDLELTWHQFKKTEIETFKKALKTADQTRIVESYPTLLK